jgi:aspartyl/asparaginyl-tRNA synthetase
MFFVELKPAPNNKDIFNVEYIQQCKIKFETLEKQKGYCSMCRLSDMGILKFIAISNRDVSNAQVTTQRNNATEKIDLVISDVSSVVEIILRISRDVRLTRTYKRKHTHLSICNITVIPHKSNKPYTLNQEEHMLK